MKITTTTTHKEKTTERKKTFQEKNKTKNREWRATES